MPIKTLSIPTADGRADAFARPSPTVPDSTRGC